MTESNSGHNNGGPSEFVRNADRKLGHEQIPQADWDRLHSIQPDQDVSLEDYLARADKRETPEQLATFDGLASILGNPNLAEGQVSKLLRKVVIWHAVSGTSPELTAQQATILEALNDRAKDIARGNRKIQESIS